MDKDKLIEELIEALDKAGEALAVAERETTNEKKRIKYVRAMSQASDVIVKARKHG